MKGTAKIGIQGALASACDEAAAKLVPGDFEAVYLCTASKTLSALSRGEISAAVLAWESPLGTLVAETEAASKIFPVRIVSTADTEVRHCLLIPPGLSSSVLKYVASHEIPLRKHRKFLQTFLGDYEEIFLDDTGLAAEQLSKGELPPETAVLALPRAGEIFGLETIDCQLPANDNYLTRFALVEKASP